MNECECGHGRHDHSNGSLWCIHGKTNFPTNYPCPCHAFRAAATADQPTVGEADERFDLTAACQPQDRHPTSVRRFVARLAPSAGQDTDSSRPAAPDVISASENERGRDMAGQDTERLREAIGQAVLNVTLWSKEQPNSGRWALEVASALLDGPLRQLIAERDEARATVQRVTNVLRHIEETPVEPDAVLYALNLRDTLRRALDGDP